MSTAIRVEIHAQSVQGACPVADVAEEGGAVSMVSWSPKNGGDTVVEEFTVSGLGSSVDRSELEAMFESPSQARYRFSRTHEGCVCSSIEEEGSPIETVRPENGGLSLSFYVSDLEELSRILSKLRDTFSGIELRRLQQTDSIAEEEPIWLDCSRLTDRQREVLQTAYEMGYFDYPRRANACEVSDALGIVPSTFSEHIATAQKKILADVFLEDPREC